MKPNENWIAEQARLIDLEDGFGPGYTTSGTTGSAVADVADEAEVAAS